MQADGLYLISRPARLSPIAGTIERHLGSFYLEEESGDAKRSGFQVKFTLVDSPRTEYHENGFDVEYPSRHATITKLQIGCQYYAINDYYWNGSAWIGTGHTHVQCTVTPYIRYNGVLYFGTPAEFGAESASGHESDPPADEYLRRLKTVSCDWATNPVTGVAWSAEDRRKISFGVRVQAPSANLGTCIIYDLSAIFFYVGEKVQSDDFDYVRLAPLEDSTVLTQYTQTPIKADDLNFIIPDAPPERSEIALIKDHAVVFHGLVWTTKDSINKPNNYEVVAKSQQILLNHRIIGVVYGRIPIDYYPLTVSALFESDAPDYANRTGREIDGFGVETTEIDDQTKLVKYCLNLPAGGLFYANSWIGEFKTARVLGDQAMLEAGEVDTFLRAGTNDLGDQELSSPIDAHGIAATVFSNIFKKYGQEVRYRYGWDGLVYQDAAVEIANGSAAEPCITVVDGLDGSVTKRIPSSPNPTAAIGSALNPKVSCAWTRAKQYFSKVLSPSRIAADLQEFLDAQIDTDDTLYDVSLQSEIWVLLPGDYMAVQPNDDALTSVRVRQIATGKGKTQILAGKRLLSLDEQFGVWRDAKYAEHNYIDLKTTEVDESTNLALSKEFTVSSDDLAHPGWQCVAAINWDSAWRNLIYEGLTAEWAEIRYWYGTSYWVEAYIQVYAESYDAYGAHEYEFYITQNMTAVGYEPYGPNDVEILTPGKFKWRKDGGAWSEEIQGYDIWHETGDYNVDLGNGMHGRVIFSVDAGGSPWIFPKTTHIVGQAASAYACEALDLALDKILVLKIGGKVIPPGRYLAEGEQASMEVDITEFCNVAGTYTLTAELIGGQAYGDYVHYYHIMSGRITQSYHGEPVIA